jgi:uncharacterized membrane protein YhaH (DUF805 family)
MADVGAVSVRGRAPLTAYLGEVAVLLGLMVVATAFIVEAPTGRSYAPTDLGSAFFPRMVAGIMIGLSLVRLVVVVWARPHPGERDAVHWPMLATMWVAIVAYPLLWEVGFVPLTVVFVLVTMAAAGVRSWKTLALSAGIYTAGAFYVFDRILNVPLP